MDGRPYDFFSHACVAYGLACPVRELQFYPTRKWRLDWAWPDWHVAIEQEGGIYTRGRHVRPVGFKNDMEKYNAAQRLGWTILRYEPKRILDAIPEIAEVLQSRGA